MNVDLRVKGLPEKKIPDANQMDQPVNRKFSKQKPGLRCTSNLVRFIPWIYRADLYWLPQLYPTLQITSCRYTKLKFGFHPQLRGTVSALIIRSLVEVESKTKGQKGATSPRTKKLRVMIMGRPLGTIFTRDDIILHSEPVFLH